MSDGVEDGLLYAMNFRLTRDDFDEPTLRRLGEAARDPSQVPMTKICEEVQVCSSTFLTDYPPSDQKVVEC